MNVSTEMNSTPRVNAAPSPRARVFLFAVVMALLLVAVAAAQPGFGKGRGGGERLAAFLELDESQQAEWQALREEHRASIEPLVADMKANRESLRDLLESDTADPTAVGELVLAGRDLRGEMKASREGLDASLAAVLTAEQQEKFEAFKAAAGERGPRGRGRRGPRGARGQR
ncbi:MAG: Spy/CpxP family protein refolding chaperone [Acidobacteriota bacterium]